MEIEDLKKADEFVERKHWVELRKEVVIKLANDITLAKQRLKVLELCDEEIAKFPEEEQTAEEAEEAVEELENELN